MAKYRPIKTSFWEDDYILELETDEKLLFLFLLSNANTTLSGIYKLSLGYSYRITGLSKERIQVIFKKFLDDKKVIYANEWVCMVNSRKHQSPSPKIEAGIRREISEIPEEIKENLYGIYTLRHGIDKLILKLKPILIPNGIKEKDKKESSELHKKIDLLCERLGIQFKSTPETFLLYQSRYSEQDIIRKAQDACTWLISKNKKRELSISRLATFLKDCKELEQPKQYRTAQDYEQEFISRTKKQNENIGTSLPQPT